MAQIVFNIPDEKIGRVVEAMKSLHPIPMIEDEQTGDMIPQFTDNQWAKECVRRYILNTVARWEQLRGQRLVAYSPDDSLAT